MRIQGDELMHTIALSMIKDVGPVNARNLVSHCGSAREVFRQTKTNLNKIPGFNRKLIDKMQDPVIRKRAEQEMKFIERHQVRAISFHDERYPSRLKHCVDSPTILFIKGDPPLESRRVLAIVGTRKATTNGLTVCESIIGDLKDSGCFILSGLAYGIDACSHRAAMKNGLLTAAVLGHGLDRIYPSTHRRMAMQMIKSGGGLITDFTTATRPDRQNFPRRNRIIAGLADAVLVVEAAASGGALITAGIAQSYDREVMAVPGRTNDEFSVGTNNMIRDNQAALVTGAEDVMAWMGWEKTSDPSVQGQLFSDLPDDHRNVIDVMRSMGETSIDFLAYRSGLSLPQVNAILFELEMKSMVRSLPGKMYRLR